MRPTFFDPPQKNWSKLGQNLVKTLVASLREKKLVKTLVAPPADKKRLLKTLVAPPAYQEKLV